MRLGLERTGGFAGLTVQVRIDTAALEPDRARYLEALAAASLDQEAPAAAAQPTDGFAYLLDLDGQQQECTEAGLCGPRADLVQALLALRRHRTAVSRPVPVDPVPVDPVPADPVPADPVPAEPEPPSYPGV